VTSPPQAMRFFIDQNVPDSVGRLLASRGNEVILLRQRIPTDSPDTLVAAVAEANSAVLVTFDPDFKALARRIGIGRSRFRTLSLIRFEKCRESRAAQRTELAFSLLEHEWGVGGGRARDRRMFVVITGETIRTHR
jgi:predicted nuclease of predicted toxin-antitoxin system